MDWNHIKEMILTEKREENIVEAIELGGVVIPLIKLNGYRVFLYGDGSELDSILSYFRANDIKVEGIVDEHITREYAFGKIPYISAAEFHKYVKEPEKTFVIFYPSYFMGMKQMKLVKLLANCGVDKFYSIRESDKKAILRFTMTWNNFERIRYYREHITELEKTYNLLADELSTQIMNEFIRVYIQSGTYGLKSCEGRNKYFAGGYSMEEPEELYTHLEEEVWVNCGACLGDTIYLYYSNGYSAKVIYAFEGEDKMYEKLCNNLDYLPSKYKNKVVPIKQFIADDTNFGDYIKEKVTLINADIEGAELDMLKTMEGFIKRDRPVLAICIYHNKEDLVDIPQYIDSIVGDYRYVLRKYPCDVAWNMMKTSELVLYAIPNERSVI